MKDRLECGSRIVLVLLAVGFGVYWAFLTGFRPLTPPLIYAAQHGDLAEVKRLVASGESVDQKDIFGRTPLEQAFSAAFTDENEGQLAVVKYLIESGARVTADSLESAILVGRLDVVKAIIARGVEVPPDGLALYVRYTKAWEDQVISYLLANGADIDILYEDGSIEINKVNWTLNALGYAVYARDFPLVIDLVQRGADVNHPVNTLFIAQMRYTLGDTTGPGVHFVTEIPPSNEIATYLKQHGAR